nr:unnamed protein product [Digitaria exilis]
MRETGLFLKALQESPPYSDTHARSSEAESNGAPRFVSTALLLTRPPYSRLPLPLPMPDPCTAVAEDAGASSPEPAATLCEDSV